MTTPPPDEPDPAASGQDSGRWAPPPDRDSPEPVSLDKPEPPFDPYRFGAPEHPVPPEYAPPGYTPPPVTAPPPTYPPTQPGSGYAGHPGAPQYQQPYSAPPNYGQQYPQPRTGNGRAIAALVLGICAVVFCWTSFFDIVFVVLAIVFGFLGLGDAKRGGGGRGMAMSGLVCGIVGALAATFLTVWIIGRIKPCLDNYDRGTSAQQDCIHSKF